MVLVRFTLAHGTEDLFVLWASPLETDKLVEVLGMFGASIAKDITPEHVIGERDTSMLFQQSNSMDGGKTRVTKLGLTV